jgi:hypothetical protein
MYHSVAFGRKTKKISPQRRSERRVSAATGNIYRQNHIFLVPGLQPGNACPPGSCPDIHRNQAYFTLVMA